MKITNIDERLLSAISKVVNNLKYNQNMELTEALDLLDEYRLCFKANGEVSQRGEIPQCWNENTIFTPHREVGKIEKELLETQLEFDYDC